VVVSPRIGTALLLLLFGVGTARATEPTDYLDPFYRADVLRSLPTGAPTGVSMIPPADDAPWPDVLRVALEERIRREWRSDRMYGALSARVAVWLRYPLVTANVNGRVVVPVLTTPLLPIEGRFDLSALRGPRRVVIVIDSPGAPAVRAIEPLLSSLVGDALEVGIVAAGEGAVPVAAPDLSSMRLREKLGAFAKSPPLSSRPGDLDCALALAEDWLRDTPSGSAREIVVLGAERDADVAAAPSPCPFAQRAAAEDKSQLAALGLRLRHAVKVSALVLGSPIAAHPYRDRVAQTDGRLAQVASPDALGRALGALVMGSVRGVFARNLDTGGETGNLQTGAGGDFAGALALLPGANDVELRIESGPGTAALFRFRVYAADPTLQQLLAELAQQRQELDAGGDDILDRLAPARPLPHPQPESLPAAPEDPGSP
jgi:hypothetical protein